jgi:tRNA-dihydrouridine synthase A
MTAISDTASLIHGNDVPQAQENINNVLDDAQNQKELHIAPMIRVSNREFRALFRILTKRATLWTEMVVDETIYFHHEEVTVGGESSAGRTDGKKIVQVPEQWLDPVSPEDIDNAVDQHPVICQIGGIKPEWTRVATRAVQEAGYDEINLNLDCPSDRVKGKKFGAVLMKYPNDTIELLKAMGESTSLPISVKCRIGVDDETSYAFIHGLIQQFAPHCQRFILHARPVLLQGLSPAENRHIPPLDYTIIYRLCDAFPHLDFWINGGISNMKAARDIVYGVRIDKNNSTNLSRLSHSGAPCDACTKPNGSCVAPPPFPAPTNLRGCMLGRAAMDHPAQFWDVDRYWYGKPINPTSTRRHVLEHYCAYLEKLYCRRCCDANPEITTRLPTPVVIHTQPYCSVCYCGDDIHDHKSMSNCISIGVQSPLSAANGTTAPEKQDIKITSLIVDRALKPFFGMFYQQPRAKQFKRACHEYSRDLSIRNCGPAYILRRAVLSSISDAALDAPFVRTEDI